MGRSRSSSGGSSSISRRCDRTVRSVLSSEAPEMSWLTERLATRMRESELTVEALARQLAIERSRLTAIIAGAALPNDNLTRRLARVFGEDPNEWLAQVSKPAADGLTDEVSAGFVKTAAVSEIPSGEMKIVCDEQV